MKNREITGSQRFGDTLWQWLDLQRNSRCVLSGVCCRNRTLLLGFLSSSPSLPHLERINQSEQSNAAQVQQPSPEDQSAVTESWRHHKDGEALTRCLLKDVDFICRERKTKRLEVFVCKCLLSLKLSLYHRRCRHQRAPAAPAETNGSDITSDTTSLCPQTLRLRLEIKRVKSQNLHRLSYYLHYLRSVT